MCKRVSGAEGDINEIDDSRKLFKMLADTLFISGTGSLCKLTDALYDGV